MHCSYRLSVLSFPFIRAIDNTGAMQYFSERTSASHIKGNTIFNLTAKYKVGDSGREREREMETTTSVQTRIVGGKQQRTFGNNRRSQKKSDSNIEFTPNV